MCIQYDCLHVAHCILAYAGFTHCEKKVFSIVKKIFLYANCSFPGRWLRRPGGQGGFRPPPYAPLDPLYPLQTAGGFPRTPLVPLRALSFAPGPQEPSRVPHGVLAFVRRQSGAATGTPFSRYLRRGAFRRKKSLWQRPLAAAPRISRSPCAGKVSFFQKPSRSLRDFMAASQISFLPWGRTLRYIFYTAVKVYKLFRQSKAKSP